MKIKDIMIADAIEHCNPETKLINATKIMKDSNCGALPVVDEEEKVIGMITDRDICLSLSAKKGKSLADLSIKEILPNVDVHTIRPGAKITDALFEMRKNKVSRLPVTDKNGKLKGMVTMNDLLSYSLDRKKKFGTVSSKKESLAKTIKVLVDRNRVHDRKPV